MAATNRTQPTAVGNDALPTLFGGALAAATALKMGWLLAKNAAGNIVAFTEATGLKSFGVAERDVDNSTGDAGDRSINAWGRVYKFTQSAGVGDSFADTDAPAVAYGVDNETVGKISTSRSPCGIFLGLDPDDSKAIVYVGPVAAALVAMLMLSKIQRGTSTLAAGTVTVSGVTLTANSRIIVTMKDPGAGAITGFADLDVPVATRNTGAGTFVVNAIDATKATINTAVCTFDWLVID
jgi:hypothetical protein